MRRLRAAGGRVACVGLCWALRDAWPLRAPPPLLQVSRRIHQADGAVPVHRQLSAGLLLARGVAMGGGVGGAAAHRLASRRPARGPGRAVAGAMRRPVGALGGRPRVPAALAAPAARNGVDDRRRDSSAKPLGRRLPSAASRAHPTCPSIGPRREPREAWHPSSCRLGAACSATPWCGCLRACKLRSTPAFSRSVIQALVGGAGGGLGLHREPAAPHVHRAQYLG